MAAWHRQRRVLLRVPRAAWRLEQAEPERSRALAPARAEGIPIRTLASAAGLSPARVHQITAAADMDELDAALGGPRAAGWPAPEDPGGDDDAGLNGRDLICDRLLDEVGWPAPAAWPTWTPRRCRVTGAPDDGARQQNRTWTSGSSAAAASCPSPSAPGTCSPLNCGSRAAAARPRDERGDGGAQAGGQCSGRGGASGASSPAGPARALHTGPAGRPGGLGGLLGVPQRCPGGAGQPGAAGLAGQRRLPDSGRCRLARRPGGAAAPPASAAPAITCSGPRDVDYGEDWCRARPPRISYQR